ncbi:hypothetical protein DFH08DRAFT_802023 [Mycena albidolilacea]|uniref:Uncharacterized protein n=1 Tax=Mycena albidolilacea TaxID=1033008 RepID=A0AAD7EZB1_9AGAR|nr:hypothetical protein DFH08DRAFT_802023 [Mycena albidolilacea]
MFVDLDKRDQASSNNWTNWFRIWLMAPNVIWDFKFLSCLSAKKVLQRVPAHWDCALVVHKRWILYHPKKQEDAPARFSILVSQNFPWFQIIYNKVSGEKMGNMPGTSSHCLRYDGPKDHPAKYRISDCPPSRMPTKRTEKESKRYRRTKARSSAQLVNCFGSSTRVLGPTSRPSNREKENIPTSPPSSQLPTSPYTRKSSPSNLFPRSADAFLGLQQRSDTYEKRYRNLAKRASRAAARMVELEICIQALQEQLCGIEEFSSPFVASLRQQLDELSAELIKRKQDDMELRLRNEELARKKQALSKKVARFDGRFETGVAKLSTQSLKEDGMISMEIRACVRDIVSFGAPVESVDKIIHASQGAPHFALDMVEMSLLPRGWTQLTLGNFEVTIN